MSLSRVYPISVLRKAFNLLDLLESHQPLSLTDLSKQAGLDKATTYRILTNLESRGYVERLDSGQYQLGFRLLQLGMRVTAGMHLRKEALPVMEELREEFDETVNLAVPEEHGIVYIEVLDRAQGLRIAPPVGTVDDFHSTALGKAMLAFFPTSLRQKFLASAKLSRKTPNTLVDARALSSELRRIHDQGYAIDNEENELGGCCVGAPIFDRTGKVIAAISVSGPINRMTSTGMAALAGKVQAASRSISSRMGYGSADGQVYSLRASRKQGTR